MALRSPVAVAALLAALSPPRAARATALDDALAARCVADPRLAPAARAALADDAPDALALRALAERAGLPAPTVRTTVLAGDDEPARAAAVAAWLAARGATTRSARCALARDGDRVAVALVPRHADVAPLDPVAAPGATRDYAFALPRDARDPVLVVAPPRGLVARVAVARDAPTRVTFADEGRYALQLVAATATGPLPFATWHVDVGNAPAPEPARDLATTRDVLAAVNALRARAGLAPLRADPLLAVVASEHAARLASEGLVAHAVAPGDSPVARLRAAHVVARRVAENVARAPSLGRAHANLAASPSHRANLLDPALDAAGLGFARAGDAVYLVELLATRPGLSGD